MRETHEEGEVTRAVIYLGSDILNCRVLEEFAGLQTHVSKRQKIPRHWWSLNRSSETLAV